MAPTLEAGDRLIADMHDIDPVRRGDVVVVRIRDMDYVKRVAGIPGDTFAIVDGKVVLNGKPVEQKFVRKYKSRNPADDIEMADATISREQFPGEAKPHLVLDLGPRLQNNFGPVVLPPDRYFLLGDNRDDPLDSRFPQARYGIGVASREAIICKLEFRYWRSGVGLGPGSD